MSISKRIFNPIYLVVLSNSLSILLLYFVPSEIYADYFLLTLKTYAKLMSFILIGFVLFRTYQKYFKKKEAVSRLNIQVRLRFFNIIFYTWLAISCFEVAAEGGLPALFIFGIASPNSAQFGIPIIHGIAQSLYFFLFTTLVFEVLMGRRQDWKILILILWALLLFNRGTIIVVSLISSLAFIYLSGEKIQLKLKYLFYILMLVALFVLVGELRGGAEGLASASGLGSAFLPFVWLYVYTVTSWVNLATTLDAGQYLLVNSMFNAMTGFYPPYYWAGEKGLYLGCFLVGLLCGYVHNNDDYRILPFKVVFSTCAGLLFFGIFLFNAAFILCLFLSYILASVTYKKVE